MIDTQSLAEEGWGGAIVEPVTEYLDNLPRREAVTYINAVYTDLPRG